MLCTLGRACDLPASARQFLKMPLSPLPRAPPPHSLSLSRRWSHLVWASQTRWPHPKTLEWQDIVQENLSLDSGPTQSLDSPLSLRTQKWSEGSPVRPRHLEPSSVDSQRPGRRGSRSSKPWGGPLGQCA